MHRRRRWPPEPTAATVDLYANGQRLILVAPHMDLMPNQDSIPQLQMIG